MISMATAIFSRKPSERARVRFSRGQMPFQTHNLMTRSEEVPTPFELCWPVSQLSPLHQPSLAIPPRLCQLPWQHICDSVILISTFLIMIISTTTVLRPFVRDYPGELVPEETFTHPPYWSSSNLYQLLPSTTIHSILPVQITCLTIFLHNLSPSDLWSTSWSGALHLILHTFLYTVTVFFSQHMPILLQHLLV